MLNKFVRTSDSWYSQSPRTLPGILLRVDLLQHPHLYCCSVHSLFVQVSPNVDGLGMIMRGGEPGRNVSIGGLKASIRRIHSEIQGVLDPQDAVHPLSCSS